jgi:DNA-binding response OmpR family regulator
MQDDINILIIEDEEIVLEVFTRILSKHFNVFSCRKVSEYEKLKESNRIDLFVIDISLGGEKDGIQLIKELRASSNYCNTLIVVVTAHAFNQDERAALAAGANKFLRKPVENDLLLITIKESLNKMKAQV